MKLDRVKLFASSLLFGLVLVFLPLHSNAALLDVWHIGTSNTVNALNGVAHGGGLFIAVGVAGTILTSPDGVTWAASTSGTALALNGVTFGNATFVAVGDQGAILMSPDGIVWTPSTSGTALPLHGITFGNGTFVAVGDSGTILTSLDGAVWTKRPSGITVLEASTFLHGVTFGNNQFVIVGGQSTPLQASAIVLTSPDGANWTQEPVSPAELRGVTFGNGIYVSTGHDRFCIPSGVCFPLSNPAVFVSADGKSWVTSGQLFTESSPDVGVAFGNGTFVVVENSGVIRASSDGFNWVNKNSGSVSNLSGAAFGNRSFVVVGDGGTILQSDQFLFGDIPSGHWAESFITALFNSGVTAGCGNGNYCPDDLITRKEMAVFLETSLGHLPSNCFIGPPGPPHSVFRDVPDAHTFCGFIENLFFDGITSGCGDGNFCPDAPVTRAQMAVFIEAALGVTRAPACVGNRFGDVNPVVQNSAFCGFIEDFAVKGITGGCEAGPPALFCPSDPVTRAEMAVFLVAAPPPLTP